MNTIKITGHVDENHQLKAQVPNNIAIGPVELILLQPAAEEDEAGRAWAAGVAREWSEELSDPREDIYTLQDGEPVDESR
jgi:hypothetical protein